MSSPLPISCSSRLWGHKVLAQDSFRTQFIPLHSVMPHRGFGKLVDVWVMEMWVAAVAGQAVQQRLPAQQHGREEERLRPEQ